MQQLEAPHTRILSLSGTDNYVKLNMALNIIYSVQFQTLFQVLSLVIVSYLSPAKSKEMFELPTGHINLSKSECSTIVF